MSNSDKQAEKVVKETMRRIDFRFEIRLFWKHDNVVCQIVRGKVEDYGKKGYARKVTKNLESNWPRISCIPIFTVLNKNKVPPKPRMVFDFAAKTGNISVNSMLLKGPDLLVSKLNVKEKLLLVRTLRRCLTE